MKQHHRRQAPRLTSPTPPAAGVGGNTSTPATIDALRTWLRDRGYALSLEYTGPTRQEESSDWTWYVHTTAGQSVGYGSAESQAESLAAVLDCVGRETPKVEKVAAPSVHFDPERLRAVAAQMGSTERAVRVSLERAAAAGYTVPARRIP